MSKTVPIDGSFFSGQRKYSSGRLLAGNESHKKNAIDSYNNDLNDNDNEFGQGEKDWYLLRAYVQVSQK